MTAPTLHLATQEDLASLRALMAVAISENLKPFLSPELVQASTQVMGLDTTLIDDATYWLARADGRLAGCGGWSRRRTLYGGDHTDGRDAALLDPKTDAARVRAMYTHPDFTRRGIGRLILAHCEAEAAREGFRSVVLMATLGGEPLYRACGYQELDRVVDGGVPLIRMTKAIPPPR